MSLIRELQIGPLNTQGDIQTAIRECVSRINEIIRKGLDSDVQAQIESGEFVLNTDPRLSDDRFPSIHALTHQLSGVDQLDLTGLLGLLADPQTPLQHDHLITEVISLVELLAEKENKGEKGIAGGYAPLGLDGLVPPEHLPPSSAISLHRLTHVVWDVPDSQVGLTRELGFRLFDEDGLPSGNSSAEIEFVVTDAPDDAEPSHTATLDTTATSTNLMIAGAGTASLVVRADIDGTGRIKVTSPSTGSVYLWARQGPNSSYWIRADLGSQEIAFVAPLFMFKAGDDIVVKGGNFVRASTAVEIDAARLIQTAPLHKLRQSHYINNFRHILIEPQRTQICPNPQTPAAWTAFGTPVITVAQPDPWGTNVAILIEDDDGANREGKQVTIPFTADAVKVVTFAVRAGSATQIVLGLRDVTAGSVDRHCVTVTWNGGLVAPTVATSVGAGLIFPSVAVYDPLGNLWWLVSFNANGVIAANNNIGYAVVGNAVSLGTFYLAGANAWDATFPQSWQPTAATRNVDSLKFPITFAPQELSLYMDGMAVGAANNVDGNWGITTSVIIGRPVLGDNFHVRLDAGVGGTRRLQVVHQTIDGATNPQVFTNVGGVTSFGDRLEKLGLLYADGSVGAESSLNGGPILVAARSAAQALGPAWPLPYEIEIGSLAGSTGGWAIRSVLVVAGIKTMAEMRVLNG